MTLRLRAAAIVGLALPLLGIASAQTVSWPGYGPEMGLFRVDPAKGALTNSVPDVVGPVDGSAALTILTEGNHYPVLLPLALEAFPAWCQETGACTVSAEEILIITLPQVMILEGLERGGFRFGNLRLPIDPNGPVYPDLLMLGEGPMGRLQAEGRLASEPVIFTKHRGAGLLLRKGAADEVTDLASFTQADMPFVMATPVERGARGQYRRTLDTLLGRADAADLMTREVPQFDGRLGIQHRDIPHALLTGAAPVGILFDHLARFYADRWPEDLRHVGIDGAEAFGEVIAVALTDRPSGDGPLRKAFIQFLLEAAPQAYEAGGFAPADTFGFGEGLARPSSP